LRRRLGKGRRKKRNTFYTAHWDWEEEELLRLAEVDTQPPSRVTRNALRALRGGQGSDLLTYSHSLSVVNRLCFVAEVET